MNFFDEIFLSFTPNIFTDFLSVNYNSRKNIILGIIRNFKNSVAAINPHEDQVIVTKGLQKDNIPYPKEIEIETPNVQNMKFDELTLGAPTPTTPRKKVVSSQSSIEVDSGLGFPLTHIFCQNLIFFKQKIWILNWRFNQNFYVFD